MPRTNGTPLIPHVNLKSIYIAPQSPSLSSNPSHDYHIFFVPGNPGCIAYYHDFLSLLAENLSTKSERGEVRRVHVYGHSLANFTKEEGRHSYELDEPRKILSLQGQIRYVEAMLEQYVHSLQEGHIDQGFANGGRPVQLKFILIGHSVGAYICMEVLRRRRAKEKVQSRLLNGRSGPGGMKPIGFIGLWPTITWIGQSPSGRKISWLLRIPLYDMLIGLLVGILAFLVRILTSVISYKLLVRVIKVYTGFPDGAARTTADFLNNPMGMKQSLLMGLDEMKEITEDRWDEDIWGVAQPTPGNPKLKLIFYFGQNDHWVADHTRDELIATRASQEGRSGMWMPKMLVDDEGIPHSFCIRHNSTTAKKSAEFAFEIMLADQDSLGACV